MSSTGRPSVLRARMLRRVGRRVFPSAAVYHASSSIKLSGTGRLLDITHMCYEYTIPLLPVQLRQPRQVELSVTFHTADSKPVTSK